MSERSRDIARRVREKAEQKRLETEKSVTEVKVRKHGLTSTWNQLSTLLSQMCDELREENVDVDLVCSFHGDEIRVTRKGTAAQIRGTRSEVTHGMEFLGKLPNGNNWSERFFVKLDHNGDPFIVDVRDHPVTVEEVADLIVSALAEA